MKKPFGIFDKKNKKYVEWMEFPIQAEKYIEKMLMGSKNFVVVDKRKKR